jgi:hypothetical protein
VWRGARSAVSRMVNHSLIFIAACCVLLHFVRLN